MKNILITATILGLTACGEMTEEGLSPVAIESLPAETTGTPAQYEEPTEPNKPFSTDLLTGLNFHIDPSRIDWDKDGYLPSDGDCDNFNPDIGPGFFDFCDNLDNDCDGEIDEGIAELEIFCSKEFNNVPTQGILWCVHWAEDDLIVAKIVCELDCQTEDLCDGVDNDCDGVVDEGCEDNDGDGVLRIHDCDDTDPTVYPGAPELCDGEDNDCDMVIDEGCPPPSCESDDDCSYYERDVRCIEGYCMTDRDGDGSPAFRSSPDCDDNDPTIYPGAPELCDGKDNNCDGKVDEECHL